MKRVLLIAAFLLGCAAHAEYGITIYEAKFHSSQGDFIGYFEADGISHENLRNPGALNYPIQHNQHVFFYKELITYAYTGSPYQETPHIDTNYILIDRDSMSVQDVDSISIINTIQWSYLWGSYILYDTRAGESDWLKSVAPQSTHIWFELCEYNINIHEDTPQTREFVARIEELSRNLEEVRARIDQDLEHGYTEDKDSLGDYYEKVENETQEELSVLFKEYKGSKIVVISFCTC